METSSRILQGDCLEVLRELPDESVHCIVTSPPYWGLRSYLPEDHPDKALELGLESTPEEYIEKLVAVFRDVGRVLRKDGTLWLDLGDNYATGTKACREPTSTSGTHVPASWSNRCSRVRAGTPCGLKTKDLVGIPWSVAFALRADGWYLRSDIIWHKVNAMPESVKDRPTRAHEYLFLFAKSKKYYYDADAVREEAADLSRAGQDTGRWGNAVKASRASAAGCDESGNESSGKHWIMGERRNRRSVWTIPTQPYPEAHFATFPEKLVEPCVLAGSSSKGCCPACLAPWERVVEPAQFGKADSKTKFDDTMQGGPLSRSRQAYREHGFESPPAPKTIGWTPTCDCDLNTSIPCTVLDPFAGSCTVGVVALRHRRKFIGIELKPEYVEMARKRIQEDMPLFNSELEV